jgi:hypothetical protein
MKRHLLLLIALVTLVADTAAAQDIVTPVFAGAQKNEIYNVAAYDGLNICWVNNEAVPPWKPSLPEATRALLDKEKRSRHFPWFATFEENNPALIKLHAEQVNLLSQFTSWALTDVGGRQTIEAAMGDALR